MATKAIKFYAEWCQPCRNYAPMWNRVTEELADKDIRFLNVDIDKDHAGLAAKYKVMSIPTTIVVKEDGTEKRKTGSLSELELKELILF